MALLSSRTAFLQTLKLAGPSRSCNAQSSLSRWRSWSPDKWVWGEATPGAGPPPSGLWPAHLGHQPLGWSQPRAVSLVQNSLSQVDTDTLKYIPLRKDMMAKKEDAHTDGCGLHSSDDIKLDPVTRSSQRLYHHINNCLRLWSAGSTSLHLPEHKQTEGGYRWINVTWLCIELHCQVCACVEQ